jgi:glucose-1-phosphate thymidylyltransferase
MKALILAGGKGTRLRPLTFSMAKQLAPVANRPVLAHCLDAIREIGVTEVGLIVGDRCAEIQEAIGDGSGFGLSVTYIHQDLPLGLAHTVAIAADWLGDDDFVMYLGDNVFADGIKDGAAAFEADRPDAQVVVAEVANPDQFGVAELRADGTVRALVEKPRVPLSNLAVTGVYFFTPAVHEAVRSISPSARGELEITDALQYLVENGRTVTATRYKGFWKDTGSVQDLLECNRALLDRSVRDVRGSVDEHSEVSGSVVLSPDAVVRRSRLTGPLVIGAGTVVSDSSIGPGTAIGDDCRILESHIESSIVLEGSRVRGVSDLRDSLIGRGVEVDGRAETSRLVLGDQAYAGMAL